jgi:hypothetical protein
MHHRFRQAAKVAFPQLAPSSRVPNRRRCGALATILWLVRPASLISQNDPSATFITITNAPLKLTLILLPPARRSMFPSWHGTAQMAAFSPTGWVRWSSLGTYSVRTEGEQRSPGSSQHMSLIKTYSLRSVASWQMSMRPLASSPSCEAGCEGSFSGAIRLRDLGDAWHDWASRHVWDNMVPSFSIVHPGGS